MTGQVAGREPGDDDDSLLAAIGPAGAFLGVLGLIVLAAWLIPYAVAFGEAIGRHL